MSIQWSDISRQAKYLEPLFANVEQHIGEGVSLYGVGQFGNLSLEYLTSHNYAINAMIDSSPAKQGQKTQGFTITPPRKTK